MKNYCLIFVALFAIFPTFPARSAGSGVIVCVDTSQPAEAEKAFATYCSRCHDADSVATSFFYGVNADSAELQEIELARFLDRHSACPHRYHEAIAKWLREKLEASGGK